MVCAKQSVIGIRWFSAFQQSDGRTWSNQTLKLILTTFFIQILGKKLSFLMFVVNLNVAVNVFHNKLILTFTIKQNVILIGINK